MKITKVTEKGNTTQGYKSIIQQRNLAWFLPRPKRDHYKGGMPLYAEGWLIDLANDILGKKGTVLNLFCGMNKFGTRVDIKSEVNPHFQGDAHKLSSFLPKKEYDVILADPPYSDEEAKELYDTPKLNYKKWTSEAEKYLKSGGLLIVYHKYVMPNPNPDKFQVVKRVFIGNRAYHLPRVAIYFRKKKIEVVESNAI